ncbi:MAG: hypothetical protein ACLFUH_10670 [Bacteroidales bacterium]
MMVKTYYLLTFKEIDGQVIYSHDKTKKLFLRLYEYFLVKELNTYAWTILPDKALFLCSTRYEIHNAPNLKEVVIYKKKGFKSLVNLFNEYLRDEHSMGISLDASAKPLDEYPSLFMAGFTAYIHCLPVFKGLSDSIVEYGWNSYLPLLHQKYTFLHHKTVMSWFGGRQIFRDFHHQMLEVKKARDVCRESGNFC